MCRFHTIPVSYIQRVKFQPGEIIKREHQHTVCQISRKTCMIWRKFIFGPQLTQPPPPGSTNVRETQPLAHGLWGSILNTGICCRSISISWFIGSPTITVHLNEFFFFCHSEPTECSYFSSTESADARITQISLRQYITSKWAQRSSG